jgi:hypothetical protein
MSKTVETGVPNTDPNTLLRLEAAARAAFPDGSMKASGLRREAAAGRLTIYAIAGKHYTTLNDIQEMKNACRVPAKALDSERRSETEKKCGSSATERATVAQDALSAKVRMASAASKLPNKSLPGTSPACMTQKQADKVIPLKLP